MEFVDKIKHAHSVIYPYRKALLLEDDYREVGDVAFHVADKTVSFTFRTQFEDEKSPWSFVCNCDVETFEVSTTEMRSGYYKKYENLSEFAEIHRIDLPDDLINSLQENREVDEKYRGLLTGKKLSIL